MILQWPQLLTQSIQKVLVNFDCCRQIVPTFYSEEGEECWEFLGSLAHPLLLELWSQCNRTWRWADRLYSCQHCCSKLKTMKSKAANTSQEPLQPEMNKHYMQLPRHSLLDLPSSLPVYCDISGNSTHCFQSNLKT